MRKACLVGWLALAGILYVLAALASALTGTLLYGAALADARADGVEPPFCHDGIVGRPRQ
jgi:hypothetical protein